jgi:cobaltochelatase CobS
VPNVWLTGGTATGKTTMAEKVADALGLEFYMHGAMEMSHELLGFVDAGGTYRVTQFVKAFLMGSVVLLDEIDSWGTGATLALNAALANGQMALPDGTMAKRHADCVVLAAGNTWGTGATADFIGRNKLDAAFLSRFPVKLHIDYDVALEQAFCGDRAWAERVQAARARARGVGLKVIIDPRHSIAGAALVAGGFTPDEAAKLTYLAGLTPEQVKQVEGKAI